MKKTYFKPINLKTIKDLNIVLGEQFAFLEKFPERKKYTTILPGIRLFFLIMFKSFLKNETQYPKLKDCDFLFISGSRNNHNVLAPLTSLNGSIGFIGKGTENAIPKFWGYFYSLPYFWKSYSIIKNAEGYERKSYLSHFETVWKTFGYTKMTYKLLSQINPKIIVVSNDHVLFFRCILRIARKLNIKTVYVQHAGVAEHFPPLEFDYALLDGKDSYDKYLSGGKINTSKIFLAGSPRFDPIFAIRKERIPNKTIGVAINQLDNFKLVEKAISQIRNISNIILIRLHPGIKGKEKAKYIELIKSNKLGISDTEKEGVEQFLKKISLLIANDSFIHFEAVLSGIQSVQYKFTIIERDGYGFVKNSFIKRIDNMWDIKKIQDEPLSAKQEKYLFNSIGNYQDLQEGKSTVQRYYEILNSLN
jgi:hypothetical protein